MRADPSGCEGLAGQAFGFIGWGAESLAMLDVLREWRPGIEKEAMAFGADSANLPLERTTPSLESLFRKAEVIFVEGGPDFLASHLPIVRLAISDRHLLVLLGRGWSMAAMLDILKERKLARCMLLPSSPGTLRTMAYLTSPYFSPQERDLFQAMFSSLDLCVELKEESHFDVLQGLAEFAPAALYTIIEAMADGVVMMGFPRGAALKYLASLLHGSIERILEGKTPPGELREQALSVEVAAAGLIEMESSGIRGTMMRAVQRAVHHRGNKRHPSQPSPEEPYEYDG
ncbi:MAG: pyrroline-5-carboxylate reductase dimerization domain-containing protein [bacterium]